MIPKIQTPLFEETIPSSKKKVMIRQFLVKEEKILLTAKQSGEERDIVRAIKQVVTNCIIDEKFDFDSLTTFDIEYLFLRLRARSVDNVVNVNYLDPDDQKTYDFDIDLDKIDVVFTSGIDTNIKIDEHNGLLMRYPPASIVDMIQSDMSEEEVIDMLLLNCVESIYDKENVYPVSDMSKEEFLDYIDNLPIKTYDKVRSFFRDLPKLYYVIKFTNSLGTEREIVLTTLRDFFILG